MHPINQVVFGRFRLDAPGERLWAGSEAVALRPKAFAVLKHLLEHPGELVTKQQLLDAVWPGTFVSDAVLKDIIRQLREALGDDAAAPQYIETAHRRGYRFIGAISDVNAGHLPESQADAIRIAQALVPTLPGSPSRPIDLVLGRDRELASMRRWLEQAIRGERQMVFVTGEAGIGKTTVVNALLASAGRVHGLRIARGQCLEQYGAGEPYLPVLDGFSRLARAPGGEPIVDILRQHAPAWLRELPSLIPAAEREALQRQVPGATRERMLREMAEAIEAVTATAPLVLVLEDLHWSDYSTIDLVAYLARRRDPARLLLIGTFRPVEVILGEHPLKAIKRELQAHQLCRELPLEYLTLEAVEAYLAVRLSDDQLPKSLARLIHRRTEGNPLFMVNVVQHLIEEGVIVEQHGHWQVRRGLSEVESRVPENVRQLIERQIERLSADERRVLEGASVVGMQCSSVAIAAGLDEPVPWVEAHCEALVRKYHFLSPARLVELPDGTITPRFKFSHVLYLEVPYGLIPPMQRAHIHARIGRRGEAIYRDRVGEIAAELAMHFEQGRDSARAVKYLLLAAENATQRSAHHESAALARRGVAALNDLPVTSDCTHQALSLRILLGVSLMATKGFAAAEVRDVFRDALELCGSHGAPQQVFMVRWLSGLFHYFRGELMPARAIAEQLLTMADDLGDSVSVIEAHRALGVCLVDLGSFKEAMEHLRTVSALYDEGGYSVHAAFAGQDPKVVAECFAARALWALGAPDQAVQHIERAVLLARGLSHVQSLVVANHFAAHLYQLRGEPSLTEARSEAVLALADEYGLEMWIALGHIHRGWARSEQGQVQDGIQELQRGLSAYEATGGKLWRGHFLGLLAQTLARAHRSDEALSAVEEGLGLIRETGEEGTAAELYRLHGELLMAHITATSSQTAEKFDSTEAEAERSLTQALAIARRQHARSWELRTSTSLGALLQGQHKRQQARQLVSDILMGFSEGHETADFKAAAAFLSQLPHVSSRRASS